MVPSKTIYVKESDMPLWERLESLVNDWGAAVSVSALIAEVMRKYLAQFGDQGDGLYIQMTGNELAVFTDGISGISAIMQPTGRGWMLYLDETVFSGESVNDPPYETGLCSIEDATAWARKCMATEVTSIAKQVVNRQRTTTLKSKRSGNAK